MVSTQKKTTKLKFSTMCTLYWIVYNIQLVKIVCAKDDEPWWTRNTDFMCFVRVFFVVVGWKNAHLLQMKMKMIHFFRATEENDKRETRMECVCLGIIKTTLETCHFHCIDMVVFLVWMHIQVRRKLHNIHIMIVLCRCFFPHRHLVLLL